MPTPTTDPPKGEAASLSRVLRELPGMFLGETVTIGELIEALSGRSFPLILLILAFPNLVPIPAPGLSAVLGVPLFVITVEMLIGYPRPVVPGFIARRRIRRDQLARACARALHHVDRLEHRIQPRLVALARAPFDRVLSLVVTLLSLVILAPIPFGNALPALAICLIAMGLLRGNGLTVLVGLIVAVLGIGFILVFAGAFLAFLTGFLGP